MERINTILKSVWSLLLLGSLLTSIHMDARGQGADWQLPADNYVSAKMDMTVTHPRPEASSWAYSKNAHPGVRWEIPIVIQGGAWPFRYEIVSDGGATGLDIGGELERVNENGFVVHQVTEEYGVLWWESPVAGSYNILVRVHDQNGNSIDVPVSLTVGTAGWVFVDPAIGDDSNDGSINAPLASVQEIHNRGTDFADHRVYLSGLVPMDGRAENGGNIRVASDTPSPAVWVGIPDTDAVLEAYEGKFVVDTPDFYMGNLEHRHHEDFFQDDGSFIHMFTVWFNTDRLTLHDNHFSRFQGNPVNTSLGNSSIIFFTDGSQFRDYVSIVNNKQSGDNGIFTSTYQLRYAVFEKNNSVNARFTLSDEATWGVYWFKRYNEYITVRANEFWDGNDWQNSVHLRGAIGLRSSRNIEFSFNIIHTSYTGQRSGAMVLWTNTTESFYSWTTETPVWLYRNSLKQKIRWGGNNLANMPDGTVITERNVLDTGDWPQSSRMVDSENLDGATYFDSQMKLTGSARSSYLGRYGAEIAVQDGGGGSSDPVASFSYSPDENIETGQQIDFTDTSTDSDGSVTGWSWDFGDGATSSEQSPAHSYIQAGEYTVSLTVTDNDGNESDPHTEVILVSDSGGEPDPPNIVFIMADDLGASDINSFDPLGRTFYETPNIDNLAQQGMKFVQAYTNAANCAPTRAALISGQYYPNQPIYHVGTSGSGAMIPAPNATELPVEKITEAEMLKQGGYQTAFIGKWHLGDPPDFGPQQQGYDVNIGGYSAGNPGAWDGGYFQPNNNPHISDAQNGEYLTDYLTRKGIEFIEDHQNGPFYLNLSYYTPHTPLQAPNDLVQKYNQKAPDRGHDNSNYAAMLENLDTNVGKIMDTLNDLDLADNTILIFYSDNGGMGGYEFLGYEHVNITDNSPLKGGKGTFYEGGIRVPLAVRWPDVITPGTTSNEPVTSIDFYPTYLEAAGLDEPADYQLDGESFLSILQNESTSLNREALYWHFPGYPNAAWRTTPVSIIRSGDWKLKKFYETETLELYNLEDDPGEENNLASTEPAIRDQLKNKLEDWLTQNNAPLPMWPDDQGEDLVLHLDAMELSADGGQGLTQWDDLSGQGNSVSGTGTYVEEGINGRPSIRFSGGSGDSFETTFSGQLTDYTVFVVKQIDASSNSFGASFASTAEFNALQGFQLDTRDGSFNHSSRGVDGPDGSLVTLPVGDVTTDPVVLTVRADGEKTQGWLQGAEAGQTTAVPQGFFDRFRLMRNRVGGGYVTGDLGEVLVYFRALSDAEREDIEQDLMAKWGFGGGQPVEGSDQRVLAGNQQEYVFGSGDFGDAEGQYSVKIQSLPGAGELLGGGSAVTAGTVVTAGQLAGGHLSWAPPGGEHGYGVTTFGFSLQEDTNIPPPPAPPGSEGQSSTQGEDGQVYTLAIDLAAGSVELTGGEGWRFLTGPATGDTYGDLLDPIWTQGVTGADDPGASPASVLVFDQQNFEWTPVGGLDQPLEAGEAFIAYVPGDDDGDGSPDGFPKTLTSGQQWAPLDGSFAYSGLDYDPDPEGINPNNVYLVGNPHPVSVDYCAMFEGATNVGSSNWIWNPAAGGGNGDYQNLNCATEPEIPIAPFQGFWVRTTGAGPALGVPEEAYIGHTEEGLFKQNLKQEEAPFHIVLDVRSEDEVFANQVNILFSGEGTLGMDRFDAPKLSASGLAVRWLSFYALDEQGRAYSFRSLPREFGEQISIPLDVETTEEGAFTLSWDLPDGVETTYWLRDIQTNQVTELSEGGKYRFEVEPTAEAGKQSAGELAKAVSMGKSPSDSDARFELVVARAGVDGPGSLGDLPDQIRLQQNYPNPFNPTTVIGYELPAQSQVRLDVYDITGRHVATLVEGQVSAGRHQVNFDASDLSSGVYLYRLQAGATIQTQKLTIIK